MSITPDSTYPTEPIVAPAVSAAETSSPVGAELGPENPPWGVVAASLTWIASVALLLSPQVLALPYVASHYRGTQPTPETLFADKTLVVILVAGILPAHLLTLLIAWSVVTRVGRVSARKVLGWSWSNPNQLWQSSILAVVLFGFSWLLAAFFGGKETDIEKIVNSSRAAALILAFLAVATAPLVEEIVYRGILFPAFNRAMGMTGAVVLVTILFAGPHVPQYLNNPGAIASITILSVALTLVRARTGRLLPCFVIHLVFNGIQSVIIILEPYLQSLIQVWRHEPVNGALSFVLHFLK